MCEEKSIYNDGTLEARVVEPGHNYCVNCLWEDDGQVFTDYMASLEFQNGPVNEAGINGIQNEPVIAILIDRLKFLDSKFPSYHNKMAIISLESALQHLINRTKDRIERGVEGVNLA
jgi:hypothetical protein